MFKYLIPRISTRDLLPMFRVALFGALVAGFYGIIHDQITWSISDIQSFARVAYFHNASYLGGLVGLIVALFAIRPKPLNKAGSGTLSMHEASK